MLQSLEAISIISMENDDSNDDDDDNQDEEKYQPKSLNEAIWQGIQDQILETATRAVDLASVGILYIAKEVVFALSGDLVAADTDDYGMTNDLEEGEEDNDDEGGAVVLKHVEESQFSSKAESKKFKSKKDHPTQPHSADIERRDEDSERSHRVEDLIKKFEVSGMSTTTRKWKIGIVPGNVGQTAAYTKPKYDTMMTQRSRTLSDGTGYGPVGKSQAIFRPRSVSDGSMDDSERFAYLVPEDPMKLPPRPEVMFSPLAPFTHLHRDNKALLDEATIDTRNIDESEQIAKPRQTSGESTSTSGIMSTRLPRAGDIPEVLDIRTEIEEIQQSIAKLEKDRAERQRLQDASPTKSTVPEGNFNGKGNKDPERAEEIKTLIQRLARLSERHKELKAKHVIARGRDPTGRSQSSLQDIDNSQHDHFKPVAHPFAQ